jgi:hypothetical protein
VKASNWCATAALGMLLTIGSQAQAKPLRLVDAHTHVMVENLTPTEEIALLKRAGIDRSVMMHTDPEAIAALAKTDRRFIIPSLGLARPTVKGLHLGPEAGPLMAGLARDRSVCGFGEIPGFVFGDNPDLQGVYAAAEATGAPLNIHTDLAKPENIAALEAAAKAHPKAKVILAHLGWTAGPELIGRLLAAHPNLYTDVSIRFDAPGSLAWRNNGLDLSILTKDGAVPPDWRGLMERYPDRFLFAMDINSFGPRYTITEELVRVGRHALGPLPKRVREAIAHGNAERLFARCGR